MKNIVINIKSYAPVIIPTLSRYEHLKKCLESLMKCTHAEKTDVYIGLDYPSKESQWDGYKKINHYLNELEKTHIFKSLKIFRRERNYGLGKDGNAENLKKYVFSKYDRLIFSEDDNQFAPAFLDYINKGLTLFENDKTVFAICGYRHFYNFEFKNNSFFMQNVDFNVWGYGIWKDRLDAIDNLNYKWFKGRLSLKTLNQIRKDNGNDRCFHFYTFAFNTSLRITDIVYSVYIYLQKFNVVMPKMSLVRNLGMDRSGENFHTISSELTREYCIQEIYENNQFNYIGSGFENYDLNRSVFKNEGLGNFSIFRLIRNLIIFKLKYTFRRLLKC